MAVAPLFVADIGTLKKEVRLDAMESTEARYSIFERAAISARAAIYSRLGEAATNAWVAIAYAENPTNESGVLRSIANLLEVELVFLRLLDSLPIFFMDDSGGTQHSWNEDGAFRGLDAEEREALKKAKQELVEEYFTMLEAAVLEDEGSVSAHSAEPDEPRPKLGGSAYYQPDGTDFDGNFHRTGLNPEGTV